MGGRGVGWRILSFRGAAPGTSERGFTLVETMVAMSISMVVLLANIYLLNTAHKDFAQARAVTAATNLATGKIADLRARVMDAAPCFAAGTTTPASGLVNYGFTGNGSPCTTGDINPDYPGLLNEDFCSPSSTRDADYPLEVAAGPSISPLCEAPGVRNPRFCDPALSPTGCTVIGRTAPPAADQRQQETTTVDGIRFTLAWAVSYLDLDHDGTAEMEGDLVKINIDVTWTSENNLAHHVTMATFTAGKS